jgi:hypothetical protein
LGCVGGGAILYGVCAFLLRSQELSAVFDMVRTSLQKRRA